MYIPATEVSERDVIYTELSRVFSNRVSDTLVSQVQAIQSIIHTFVHTKNTYCFRCVSNIIYDIKMTSGGLYTQKALTNVLNGDKNNNTQDHVHSRQILAETFLLDCWTNKTTPNATEICQWLQKATETVCTTKNENMDLRPHQNKLKHWKLAYQAAGITHLYFVPPEIS